MPRADLKIEAEEGALLDAVTDALKALKDDPAHKYSVDKAMHRLAKSYAQQIDKHIEMVRAAEKLLEEMEKGDGPEMGKRQLNAIMKFTESNQVLSDLGPRLQSVLETLGASPKARAQMIGSRGGGKPDDAGAGKPEESALERRRREERARQERARADGSAPVDASAS